MSPTCSKRFLAGRKARSAAVLITGASPPRVSAQLWASGRDLDAPPAHQHPDEAESRRSVVVLAARLADVPVRQALPLVRGGIGRERLEMNAVLLLGVGPLAHRVADLLGAV